jgi:hypothetical protein
VKNPLRFLWRLLPHITLILSLAVLTFFTIDLFNESMAFLNNSITKITVAALSLLCAVLSVVTVIRNENK